MMTPDTRPVEPELPMDAPAEQSIPLAEAPSGTLGLVALAAAAASVLAACGGGGSDSVAVPAPAPGAGGAAPGTPSPGASTRTPEEAALFLSQATLGASRAQITAATTVSLENWLNDQFAEPISSHVSWLQAQGYADPANINSTDGMDNTIWRTFIGGDDALRQRVVFALSEICVASVSGVNSSWRQFAMANYLDVLQTHAFGNYRQLLQAITLSPAMGYFLTYRGSVKANPKTGSEPDENYGRELMQLFTIGLVKLRDDGSTVMQGDKAAETYGPADVSGLARVFTGWNLDTAGLKSPYPPDAVVRPMVPVASNYETGSKQFLGTTIAAGTDAQTALGTALDTLFNHPNMPPFIGRQLIQRMVTSNPSAGYVSRVAAAFINNGQGVRGDMRAVIRAILLDPSARDASRLKDPTWGKLREPVHRMVHWARAFSANSPAGNWNIGDLSDPAFRLGQSPLRSPSVFNFFRPGYVPPNTALAARNLVGPEFQITNESTVAGYVNFMQSAIAGKSVGDLRADYSGLLALAPDAQALATELKLVLTGGQLSDASFNLITGVINGMPAKTPADLQNRVYAALTLVLAAPEYIVQK